MKRINPELEQLLKKISSGEVSLSTEEKKDLTARHQNDWVTMDEINRAFCESRIPKEKNIKNN